MRILIIRLDAIGDMVLMSPFLRELRGLYPGAHITLLVQPQVFNLVEMCPYIDEVRVDLSLVWLWRQRWDLAISPRFDVDHFGASRILLLSFARRQVRWRDVRRFNQPAKHEVERNLEVLTWLGARPHDTALGVWRGSKDEQAAQRLLSEAGKPLVALVPGASHPAKQWPLEKFIEVAQWLAARNFTVVVLGAWNERPLVTVLAEKLGGQAIDLTGATTLREAGAVLARCQIYVGNDTGLMHLAAAEGVPVVMISRHPQGMDARFRSSPERFGPWGGPKQVVQPRVGDITTIAVHDVINAITTLLGRGISRSHAERNGATRSRARL